MAKFVLKREEPEPVGVVTLEDNFGTITLCVNEEPICWFNNDGQLELDVVVSEEAKALLKLDRRGFVSIKR